MNNALARVYALQQRELNDQERARQQQIAKLQRLIAAFNAAGLLTIFNEFRSLPVRDDVRRRIYRSEVSQLSWHSDRPADQTHSMSFVAINGFNNGPRWWCEEDADSGAMRYGYSSGASGDRGTLFSTPQGEWLDHFIAYIAAAADQNAVLAKIQSAGAEPAAPPNRRQLQPI